MKQVMRSLPWLMPGEPERFVEIFRRYGRERILEKDALINHGGDDGEIGLLVEGLAAYTFIDNDDQLHIFGLIAPGSAIGDPNAFSRRRVNALAECLRKSRCLVMKNTEWRRELRRSMESMEAFSDLAVLKEESIIEGGFANFTLDLDSRLRVLLLAIFRRCGINTSAQGFYCVPLDLTITEIARIVSANRSWVSSKISEWCARGFMDRSGRALLCHSSLFEPARKWIDLRLKHQPASLPAEGTP